MGQQTEQATTARDVRLDQQQIAARFAELAGKAGISIANTHLLGGYLHIDYTRAADEGRLIEVLSAMKPLRIAHVPRDAKGRHLDDSTAYRIVADFGRALSTTEAR